MVLSTRVYVEHPDLALTPTIQSLPDAEIGVVPDVGTNPQQNVYFFWIDAEDFVAVETALAEDHTVAEFTAIIETADRRTYRIRYSDEVTLITPAVTEVDAIVVESRSRADGWELQLQFQDHEDLYALHEHASEADIRFDMLEIHQDERNDGGSGPDLTEEQVEVLVSAYEHGYYEEPRETNLAALGSALDISQTAVSSRLRRASGRLIEETLGYDEHEEEP
jgi:predicted DNA binding protein